ncbi:MAG TPA: sigma-70 family RNA polymerase sigma factor [Acidimicrobiia bacterium]|jgi:RNA polymerase sigma-70 factor (ECF subfamily)|nr:sigma-70 family RNA polymerase sigma factor [Acidimicrobiia bacterium]
MGAGSGRRDWDAFEQFCTHEYARLVGAVALAIGDSDVAADAVNEALARAWNRVRRGHDIETLGAWLRVVAVNIGYDEHRRRAVERKHTDRLVAASNSTTDADGWGVSIDVREALSGLPRRQREVAVLYFICELTVAAIAHELHISEGTVKTCLQRARLALHSALDDGAEQVSRRDAS